MFYYPALPFQSLIRSARSKYKTMLGPYNDSYTCPGLSDPPERTHCCLWDGQPACSFVVFQEVLHATTVTSGAYSRNYCPGPSDGNMNKRTQLVGCAMDSLLFALVFAFTFLVFVFGYRCCSKLCWVRLSNYQLEPKPRYLTRRTNVIWPWLNGDHNNIKIVRHFKDIFTSLL